MEHLMFLGGKPKNFPVIANAGSEIMSHCTLFRNVSRFFVTLHISNTAFVHLSIYN